LEEKSLAKSVVVMKEEGQKPLRCRKTRKKKRGIIRRKTGSMQETERSNFQRSSQSGISETFKRGERSAQRHMADLMLVTGKKKMKEG